MGIFSEFQSMMNLFQKAGKMDLYKKISELMEDVYILREENTKLKDKLKIKKLIKFDKDVCWLKDEKVETKEGPFCPNCWDAEELLMHMIKDGPYARLVCPKCNLDNEAIYKEMKKR